MRATDSIVIPASREVVFDILCDPHCYVTWVVGAGRVRRIDDHWPEIGSRFHHTVGIPPFEVHDATEITRCEKPSRVALRAMVRPFFEATVDLRLDALAPDRTRVTMVEEPIAGVVARAGALNWPALTVRNRLALRRLARTVARHQAREQRA